MVISKILKWYFVTVSFLMLLGSLTAQNFIMDPTPVNSCAGSFFDSGGSFNRYSNNEDIIKTICPSGTSGTHIEMQFLTTDLGPGDDLCIYDGTSIAAPEIVCSSTQGNSANGAFKVAASAPNISGCLTFRFTSDNVGTGAGWEAVINCIPAHQQVIAELQSTNPASVPSTNGWIDICPGGSIEFTARGLYPQNGFNYSQSDATSNFYWDFGDGNIGLGPNVTHTYQRSGGYTVQLVIEDVQGCTNNNTIAQRVRVATKPTFDFDADFPSEVCANDTLRFLNNINESSSFITATPNEGRFDVQNGNVDSIPLPDGVNVAYESPVLLNEFIPGAVITNPAQIESICINIEHSYVRDLDISLVCPNGNVMRLDTTNASFTLQTFLGVPYELDDNIPGNTDPPIPGTGYTYCFTPNAQFGTFFQQALMQPPRTSLPEGDYTPIDGFQTLIGCPLNGEWKLVIEDRLNMDNGWLFWWSIDFIDALKPPAETYTPNINTWGWVDNGTMIFNDQDSMLSVPGAAGTLNYIFEVVDDFGCTFDTTITYSVLSEADPRCFFCDDVVGMAPDQNICEGEEVPLEAIYNGFDETTIPFVNNTNVDFGATSNPPSDPLESDIAVAGASPGVITNPMTDIASVCIDIDSGEAGDLQIYLQAPSGEILELTTNNGGTGDNFTGTCFRPNLSLPNITSGSAPFTGDWLPEGNWSNLIGSQVNGRWTLLLSDGFGALEVNTLLSWSISFNSENIVEYSWSPSLGLSCNDCPDPNASPNVTTEYIVNIRDGFGCSGFDTIVVSVVPDLASPIVDIEDPAPGVLVFEWLDVPNASSYEVNLNGGGWFPPNNGSLSHFLTGLIMGDSVDFKVRGITDIGSCNREETCISIIYGECFLSAEPSVIREISCFGADDAAIAANVMNSTPPLVFTLDGTVSQALSVFQGVGPGMHNIVVEDADGCLDTVFFDLVEPPVIQIDTMSTDVTCAGGNDGTLFASATGGVGNFDYLWTTVPTTFDSVSINQGPGSYTVQVTDENGCRTTATARIGEPSPIMVTLLEEEPSCNGGRDGTISTTVIGGAMPYSYEWEHGEFTADIFVEAGNYTLTVTDANLCEQIASIQILEPDPLEASAVGMDASCHNTLDGSATIDLVGSGPFSFLWDDPMSQTTQTAVNLAPGVYNFTLTDESTGCNSVGFVGIGAPSEVMATTTSQRTSCFGGNDGTATVDVVGGVMPYSFLWNDSAGQTTQTAINLVSGDYEVIITDGRGCSTTRTAFVDTSSEIVLSVDSTFASCIENADGSASVFPIGGTGFYTYEWNDPMNQTTSLAEDLAVGFYTVTVTDSNMCEVTEDIEVIAGDPVRIDSIVGTMPSCFGENDGTLVGFISGGEAPYSYLWCDDNGQFQNPATMLFAGNYCLTVTDENGCTADGTVVLNEPDLLEINSLVTDIDCFGAANGVIDAVVTGGTYPYEYTINNQVVTDSIIQNLDVGNYIVLVTDRNDCTAQEMITISEPSDSISIDVLQRDTSCFGEAASVVEITASGGTGTNYDFAWSDSALPNSNVVTGLLAQTYIVTVSDENQCTFVDSIAVVEFDEIEIQMLSGLPTCNGFEDAIVAANTVMGGAGEGVIENYTYSWENYPNETTNILRNVPGGAWYQVTVTDRAGCTAIGRDSVGQPDPIQFNINKSNPSCYEVCDGFIEISNVTGAISTPIIEWSTGETTPRIEDLCGGNFLVTITDGNGCRALASVNLNEPDELISELEITDNICAGELEGVIVAEVVGGSVPYQFDWSNGESGLPFISDLSDGDYSVVITDANGCVLNDTTNLTAPEALMIEAEVNDITCFDGSDGSYTLNVTGGQAPYRFSTDGEFFTPQNIRVGLETGPYPVFVRDSRGCTWDSLIQIGTVPKFELFAGEDQFIEIGDTARLDVVLFNPVGIPEIVWSSVTDFDLSCDECSSTSVSPLFTATYEAYGIDENGCESNDFVTVFVSKTAQIMVPTGFTPNADGNNDLLIVHGKSKNIVRINEFRIYDRWGETVYENNNFDINDTAIGWDGTFRGEEMDSGIYVWVLEVQFEDGSTDNFTGHTTLIR